jgi:hypothetical protein
LSASERLVEHAGSRSLSRLKTPARSQASRKRPVTAGAVLVRLSSSGWRCASKGARNERFRTSFADAAADRNE